MATIIQFKSALKKVSAAKNASRTSTTTPHSGRPDESVTPSNSVKHCRSFLTSLNKFADQLDKQIADIDRI